MLSGALSMSVSIGQWLNLRIHRTFKIWVRTLGRSFADNAGGKGNLSDNLNAAAPSCWKSDQGASTISSVSKMYPTAAIRLISARDPICISRRFRLPCHISTSRDLWPFCAISVPLPLSSSLSHFLCLWHPILVQRLPKSRYWLEQTALQWVIRKGSRLWFLTPSS